MGKKISLNRAKKEKIVASLADKVSRSKGLVFTNYQGLTHKQLEGLKKKIKTMSAELIATKNSLLKLALKKTPKTPFDTFETFDTFKNATATLFLYADPVLPLKELAKVIKEFSLPSIKFGILDGKALTSEQLIKIASLPPRDILLVQLVANLKSPIFGLHRALGWNLQRFAMTLKAIESQNSKSQAPNSK